MIQNCIPKSYIIFLILTQGYVWFQRKRKGERKKERSMWERNIDWSPLKGALIRDSPRNPDMCPHWDLNPQPSVVRDSTQPNKPLGQGWNLYNFINQCHPSKFHKNNKNTREIILFGILTFIDNIELTFIKTQASLNNGSCYCAACVTTLKHVQLWPTFIFSSFIEIKLLIILCKFKVYNVMWYMHIL